MGVGHPKIVAIGTKALNLLPSAARLRGFEEGLGLTGNQFATILSIFFVGYIVTQVPSYAPRS